MTDRETIESALQRVQSGELSPAEATRMLLAADENGVLSHVAPYESLASLVNRLGTPPADIVASWCQQMRVIACQHEQELGASLPAIDLDHWSITPQGALIWNGHPFDLAKVAENPSARSMGHIDEFHAALGPEIQSPTGSIIAPTDDGASTKTSGLDVPRDAPTQRVAKQAPSKVETDKTDHKMHPLARRALFMIVGLACIGAAGFVLYNASRPESVATTNNDTPAGSVPSTFAPHIIPDRASGRLPSTETVLRGSPDSAETLQTLETFELMSEAELSSIEAAEIEMKPSFSLDDLMPPAAGFVPAASGADADSPAAGEKVSPPASDPASSSPMPTSDAVEQVLSEDEAAPHETPQQTRTSMVMAIALPGIDEFNESTTLSESKLSGLKLDFPFEVPLTISGDESEWEIRDSRKHTTVAAISASADGTELKWCEPASDSPSASALAHGRITDRDGGTIFLRPNIEADPWSIRVDKPDVMPTWNLRYPIPPRVARFSVDFDLPEEVEEGWIEPIDPESLRRARALAVLTPKDGETVSLGIRFDVRCGKKLSCRIRYAGRLDPSMPWQVVSVPLLEQFANQLTNQATLVSNEATRLSRVYDIAGTSGRRILRVKQNRNDALADSIRTASDRVAQLQSLIATLETEGTLRIRIWVDWPDATQTLLSMPSEAKAE